VNLQNAQCNNKDKFSALSRCDSVASHQTHTEATHIILHELKQLHIISAVQLTR